MCSRMISLLSCRKNWDGGEARDEELGELLVIRWGAECIGGLSWWGDTGLLMCEI